MSLCMFLFVRDFREELNEACLNLYIYRQLNLGGGGHQPLHIWVTKPGGRRSSSGLLTPYNGLKIATPTANAIVLECPDLCIRPCSSHFSLFSSLPPCNAIFRFHAFGYRVGIKNCVFLSKRAKEARSSRQFQIYEICYLRNNTFF